MYLVSELGSCSLELFSQEANGNIHPSPLLSLGLNGLCHPGKMASYAIIQDILATYLNRTEFAAARAHIAVVEKDEDFPLLPDPTQQRQQLRDLASYIKHLERDNTSLRKNVSASGKSPCTCGGTTPSLEPDTEPHYIPITERPSVFEDSDIGGIVSTHS